jgi:hypothetical protein
MQEDRKDLHNIRSFLAFAANGALNLLYGFTLTFTYEDCVKVQILG